MKIKRTEKSLVRSFRFPEKLFKIMAKHAAGNGRTIAQEIIYRLQQSIAAK